MARLSVVAAVGKNGAIGMAGKLLWYFPEDLARFKATTMGHPIIMGRKTHQSIGRALPGRTNIVITRDRSFTAPDCVVRYSLDEAIAYAESLDQEEVFIIGGGEIYREAWPRVTRLYLTEVDDAPEADIFLPNYSEFSNIIFEEPGEEKGMHYSYRIRERA